MKRLETIINTKTGREARVYRDSDWQEWRVKFYEHGIYLAEADYHTDDKADAMHTARSWTWAKPEPESNDEWIDGALMAAYESQYEITED